MEPFKFNREEVLDTIRNIESEGISSDLWPGDFEDMLIDLAMGKISEEEVIKYAEDNVVGKSPTSHF